MYERVSYSLSPPILQACQIIYFLPSLCYLIQLCMLIHKYAMEKELTPFPLPSKDLYQENFMGIIGNIIDEV